MPQIQSGRLVLRESDILFSPWTSKIELKLENRCDFALSVQLQGIARSSYQGTVRSFYTDLLLFDLPADEVSSITYEVPNGWQGTSAEWAQQAYHAIQKQGVFMPGPNRY